MDFYSTSARILDAVLAAPSPPSLKQLCSHHAKDGSPTRCYAIIAETLKYLPVLEKLLKSIDVLKAEAKVLSKKATPSSKSLVLVLMHDMLFSKRGIALPKEHKVRQAVERYTTRLKANLQREKLKQKVTSNEALQVSVEQYIDLDVKGKKRATAPGQANDEGSLEGKIRWLRVNENKWTTEDATTWLEENGWKEVGSLEDMIASGGRTFCLDEHIPNLVAFPLRSISLPKFQPYTDAKFIAQDKASCMPAYLLLADSNTLSDINVMDATSAPGNKTSYVSGTLSSNASAKVYACERDATRYQTLQKMLRKAGCKNVLAAHVDFLEIDPAEDPYRDVTHILVDPSCSGSGIHDDEEENPTSGTDLEGRLGPLSKFQRHILAHALSFPKVQRVVYSTCSIHQDENENVIFSTLEKEGIAGFWDIARRKEVLPDWPLRGQLPSDDADATMQEQAEGLIRCERRLGTHGFFVAVFVRRPTEQPELQAESLAKIVEMDAAAVTAAGHSQASEQSEAGGIDIDRQGAAVLSEEKTESDFSLLRLATLDRKRRREQEIDRLVRKAARSGHECGCGHEHA